MSLVLDVVATARAVARAQWYFRHATSVARTVRLLGHPAVSNQGSLRIGDRARLVSTIATLEIAVGPNGSLEIGERAFVNYGTSISALDRVSIGPRCHIGTHCMILDNEFHRIEPELRDETPPSRPVVLGENVWLGGRVIVLPGVTIGDGSVIGAGSVVTKDVPPRCVAAGVPARVIKPIP